MGTWYETCAISHLPIRYNDEAMIFYIKKREFIHKEWSAGGEADKWYTPVAFPFPATCNIDENFDSHEKEVTNEINQIRTRKKENYDIMFILKPMYDEVVKEMRERKYDRVLQLANEFIEQAKKLDIEKPHFMWDLEFRGNRFVDFYQEHDREMRSLLIELAKQQNETLKEQMIELILFHYGLDMMRQLWHPGNGRGAQDREYYLYRKIAELVIEKEAEERAKWLEENILDESESEDDITKAYLWYL